MRGRNLLPKRLDLVQTSRHQERLAARMARYRTVCGTTNPRNCSEPSSVVERLEVMELILMPTRQVRWSRFEAHEPVELDEKIDHEMAC